MYQQPLEPNLTTVHPRELSILIAEQNVYKALKISLRTYIMNLGRIVKHFKEVPSIDISNVALYCKRVKVSDPSLFLGDYLRISLTIR
jgi:hypothetical protein